MGHIRLGTLPQSKKWRDVVGLLESDAPLDAIAEAAARASEYDLKRATNDPGFQFVTSLLVRLPFLARAPGFEEIALAPLRVDGRLKPRQVDFLPEVSDIDIDHVAARATVVLVNVIPDFRPRRALAGEPDQELQERVLARA